VIEVKNVSKSFDEIKALNDISLNVKEGEFFGLVGTNGAGKSTLLRIVCGIYKQDSGDIIIDEKPVYDDVYVKSKVFFVPDDFYYFPGATAEHLMKYYLEFYPEFDTQKYYKLISAFNLGGSRRISSMSKGMRRQVYLILGFCANTKYLICDETFDGLDPVIRQTVKSLFAKEMDERGLTPIIASHNLRELEDICDHVGLLHKGGILLSENIGNMKVNMQKIQCVFVNDSEYEKFMTGLNVVSVNKRGRLNTITVRGSREELISKLNTVQTQFYEVLPLTLEEIFIEETEVVGYDIKKLILE